MATYKSTISKFLAIDTETTGLFGHHGCLPFAISTCDQDGNTNYWEAIVDPETRIPKWSTKVTASIHDYVSSFDTIVFHNMNFDLFMLSLLPSPEWKTFPTLVERSMDFHDTMVRAHVIRSDEPLGLKEQALLHCDILDDDEEDLDNCIKDLRRQFTKADSPIKVRVSELGLPELAGQKTKFFKCDFWLTQLLPKNDCRRLLCKQYAIKDAIRTAALFIRQEQTFEEHPELVKPYEIQRRVTMPVYRMMKCGISLHSTHFPQASEEATITREQLITRMRTLLKDPEFNPNSGPQLSKALFDKLKFQPVKVTDAGNNSTDKSVLPELKLQKRPKKDIGLDFVDAVIAYREVNAANNYLSSYSRFQVNNKLHPSIRQTGTSTTRMASENPNGQNIGKGKERIDENGNIITTYCIRKVFGPIDGRIWSSIDYDQLQLRIFAYWSKDPKLIKAFEDGFDFHTYMAMQIFETDEPTKIQRRVAKNVNFGYIFGAGENKIDATCGIKGIFRRVQALFPCVTESIDRTVSFVKRHGYVLTASGYKLQVPRHKAYAGVNYIVQGTEGDIVKTALTNCDSYLLQSKLALNHFLDIEQRCKAITILQIHDELLFSLQKSLGRKKIIKVLTDLATIMQDAGKEYGVPCICKPEIIEDNWSQAVKLQDWK